MASSQCFICGVSLLPLAPALLVSLVLGPDVGSPHSDVAGRTTYTVLVWKDAVLKVGTVFALAYSTLLLYTGYSKIAGIAEEKAALAVSSVLAVSLPAVPSLQSVGPRPCAGFVAYRVVLLPSVDAFSF